MLEIVIHQPGSADGVAKLENGAYLIGSGPECHIRINRPEVSSRHAQMIVHDNRMTVMDLGSRNGTFSGEGVSFYPNEPYDVPVGTVIRVGRAELLVRTAADRKPVPPSAGRDSAAEEKLSLPGEGEKEPIPLLKVTGVPERYRAAIREIKRQAHRELLTRLNLKKLAVSGVS